MFVAVLTTLVSNIHSFTLSSDTNILNISPTSTNCHQLYVANITLSSTSLSPYFRYSLFFPKMDVIFYLSVSIRPKSCVTKLDIVWEMTNGRRASNHVTRCNKVDCHKCHFLRVHLIFTLLMRFKSRHAVIRFF